MSHWKKTKINKQQKLHNRNLLKCTWIWGSRQGAAFEYIWIDEGFGGFLSIVCRKYVKNTSGKDYIVLI